MIKFEITVNNKYIGQITAVNMTKKFGNAITRWNTYRYKCTLLPRTNWLKHREEKYTGEGIITHIQEDNALVLLQRILNDIPISLPHDTDELKKRDLSLASYFLKHP